MAAGKLEGPAAELMSPTVAPEQLFDTFQDPHEINNLADSNSPEHQEALLQMRAALDTWIVETRGASRDHPVMMAMPETAYLKCAVLRVF